MSEYKAQDPDFEKRVRESFNKQSVMTQLGATLLLVRPGEVEIGFPYQKDFSQQHGFLHAGIVATVLDSACGYAAFSLMPAAAGVVSIEFKVNLLAPAVGESFIARGEVIRPGKTITVCAGEAVAVEPKGKRPIAAMQATMMTMIGRSGFEG